MTKERGKKDLNRRDFIKTTAVGVGATALTSLSLREVKAAPPPPQWDKEAEVVVVGYGAAGAATAITAHDKGTNVLIIEKQSESGHTSNTQMCYGVFVSPDNVADAIAYMGVCSRVNVDMPESQDIDDETIRVWAEYMVQNKDWLTSLGAKEFSIFAYQGRDSSWPGNSSIKAYQIRRDDGAPGIGVDFFNFLDARVKERNIEILWQAPALRLVANEAGEVLGVMAHYQGQEIAIKAAKAVVLTCGGFEFDEAALKAFLPAYPMVFYGNPDNTGDGMRMATAMGADLWHMTVLGGGFKMKFDDFPTALNPSFGPGGGYVVVDKLGKRFKSETQLGGYSAYWNALVYDTVKYTWPRIPVYWIFDEKRRTAGPIVATAFGAAGPIGMYSWSPDNSVEIMKGWIVKAETPTELASKLDVDPSVLAQEISKYNGFAQSGNDADFGRPGGSMDPIDTPPFYAVPLWPGLNNSFGGPRRNAQAQIVNAFGEPIPRLYSAGELGSIYVQYPQGGANVGECLAFGRIAGENASALEPWE